MKIDRTGLIYGHLIALRDTGKLTKKGERIWAARCTVVRDGKECGRVTETHLLGQRNAPKSCGCLATPLRDITGQVFAGWKAVRRTDRESRNRDHWLFECPTCQRQVVRHVNWRSEPTPCTKCHPAPPRRRPPQKVTTKDYPVLRRQLALLWLRLKDRVDAGEVVEIPVGGGRYSAFVDASDAPLLLPYAWRVSPSDDGKTFYARGKVARKDVSMHRLILGLTDPNVITDHKDHCGFNNTRENIRPVTHKQDAANTRKRAGYSSQYKGVSRKSGYGWAGTIEYNGKKRHLGYFENEIDAARAYNDAAEELFGEYACLNLVPRKPPASVGLEEIAIA